MIVRSATIAIAMTVLAAGALGFATGASTSVTAATFNPHTVTTVEKNQIWPIKGNITVEPCAIRFCQEV